MREDSAIRLLVYLAIIIALLVILFKLLEHL